MIKYLLFLFVLFGSSSTMANEYLSFQNGSLYFSKNQKSALTAKQFEQLFLTDNNFKKQALLKLENVQSITHGFANNEPLTKKQISLNAAVIKTNNVFTDIKTIGDAPIICPNSDIESDNGLQIIADTSMISLYLDESKSFVVKAFDKDNQLTEIDWFSFSYQDNIVEANITGPSIKKSYTIVTVKGKDRGAYSTVRTGKKSGSNVSPFAYADVNVYVRSERIDEDKPVEIRVIGPRSNKKGIQFKLQAQHLNKYREVITPKYTTAWSKEYNEGKEDQNGNDPLLFEKGLLMLSQSINEATFIFTDEATCGKQYDVVASLQYDTGSGIKTVIRRIKISCFN